MGKQKPLISIGIIFKNDIRSIERCLKALQPLRDAVPSELVMTDTGSTDGSREVAERYADILVDFPWIDDFSAARNANIEQASGVWFFSVDTDEYLDEDVSELVSFLHASRKRDEVVAMVVQRNYRNYEMDGDYSDFSAGRVVRMSTGVRYEGAIHEHYNFNRPEVKAYLLRKTILHHDGYVAMNQRTEEGKAKQERNIRLLRKSLEEEPDNLLLCMQLIESGTSDAMPDYVEHLRRTVKLVQEKKPGWQRQGPPILRHALYDAEHLKLPDWDEWLKMAEEWFPDSIFTRLDVQYVAFAHYWNTVKDYEEAFRRAKLYLKGLEDYRNGADPLAGTTSVLKMATPYSECHAKVFMISAYCEHNRQEEAFELVQGLDYSLLSKEQVGSLTASLQNIHFRSEFDTAPVITALWEEVNRPEEEKKDNLKRKYVFLKTAGKSFLPKNREDEKKKDNFVRHAYTLYLPLRGKCELGTAAAVMDMKDPAALEGALAEVKDWSGFPVHALARALEYGVRFPVPGTSLNVEEMDSLASRLTQEKDILFPLAVQAAENTAPEDWRDFVWARGLVMAAVRAYPWSGEGQDGVQGMTLARAFAKVEKEFLPRCYVPELLGEDGLFTLPALHRFGWYCAQAFEALDSGSAVGYVRLLRKGLAVCESVKDMAEFLLDHTPELGEPSDELRVLAGQIRTILAAYSPDDPAVAALKASEAYQKVACLIEGVEPPIAGGQLQ